MQLLNSIRYVIDVKGLKVLLRHSGLLILLMLTGMEVSAAASTDLNEDDVTRLKRGEILLQNIHVEKSGAAARVTALFHSNTNAVWDIIGYCRYQLVYMQGLKLCEVVEGDQFHMTMRHRIRNSWYTPTMDFTFEANREPGGNGQVLLLGGDLNILEGQWKLIPLAGDNHVIVIHEIRIQPKIPAPKWLVRRSLRKDLPGMLACIRGLARASGEDNLIEGDLKQCPGRISELSK